MSFADLGLLPPLADALSVAGLHEPTPVQRIAVPAILGGASVVVVARTGSGKTLAYALPMLQRLHAIEAAEGMVDAPARPRAVVLTGTRELVDQTMRAIKGAAHALKARVRAASGGLTERQQRLQLAEPFDVLVANPPRLVTLLDAGRVSLEDVRLLVVDEADTLLSPGQRGDIERLLAAVPASAARAYVSATLPESIRAWLLARPERPSLLLSKDAHSAPESVTVQNVKVKPIERLDATHDALVALPPSARGILFCNRRETADVVAATLRERGHAVAAIHGALEPEERRRALKAFRGGEGRVLVTTELGGRGLHLDGLVFVLNYELPEKASEYLHRIGRVGRQGAKGKVINLVTADDAALLGQIDRLKSGGRLDTGEKLRAARERKPPPEKPLPPRSGGGAARTKRTGPRESPGPKRGKGGRRG
jgi:ATP-dependent RNA helicase RhlE